MILFPAFLKLEGRRCLVAGAGPVAEEKIEGLLKTGAEICVVAPDATTRIRALADEKKIRWEKRKFLPKDLAGAFVVVAATSSPSLHARIFKQARLLSVLCNVVDDPEHCDFYYGAVVRRGALQIAISTSGRSPALAQRLRKKMEKKFGEDYELWIEELGQIRERLFAKKLSSERRRALLHRLASRNAFEEFVKRNKRRPLVLKPKC